MDWEFIAKYTPEFVHVGILTLKIGGIGIILSIIVGILGSWILYENFKFFKQIVIGYIELSRNTPLLVQLFFLYFGLPKVGLRFSPEACGIIGLTFLGGSYMIETFRSALETIDKIQKESALSLGMTKWQTMRYVILPQSFVISLPGLTANIIFLLKETSVFSAISLMDMMFVTKDLGVKVEYISLDPASRVEYAETAKADIVAANFTVTPERAEKVDFSLPYMKVSLGVVSPDKAVIKSIDELKDKTLIVSKGTTAEYYFSKNHPEIKLQKYDSYADAYNALLDGRGDAFSTDNTEVLAWAKANPGFTVGIDSLGDVDTIAVAVQKGNKDLLDWINNEIKELGKENFFHEAYKATLEPIYGDSADPDSIVIEGGQL